MSEGLELVFSDNPREMEVNFDGKPLNALKTSLVIGERFENQRGSGGESHVIADLDWVGTLKWQDRSIGILYDGPEAGRPFIVPFQPFEPGSIAKLSLHIHGHLMQAYLNDTMLAASDARIEMDAVQGSYGEIYYVRVNGSHREPRVLMFRLIPQD